MNEEWMFFADAGSLEAFGEALAQCVDVGDMIALSGGLGAGKTTLARGILRGLGYGGEAPSPTFAILQGYELPELRLPVAHVDLYRIESPEEVEELGLSDWLMDGAVLVEWPERGSAALTAHALQLNLEPEPTGGRGLTARVPGAWEKRWQQLPI